MLNNRRTSIELVKKVCSLGSKILTPTHIRLYEQRYYKER
jgi:hypothetical protein